MAAGSFFYTYARRGLANAIDKKLANGRGEISININTAGETQTRSFQLLGREDITGFVKEKILRRVPEDGANVFAPYNLAFVEFYEEDFPWRFTPEPVKDGKLMPWLFLVVLKDGEFSYAEPSNQPDPTLKYIKFADSVKGDILALQEISEISNWAHVQAAEGNTDNSIKDPDGIISRIICPRKLDPNTAYQAFLIPTYEGEKENHLVFHTWRFQTNNEPDFEYLAGLLEPQPVPPQFGRRSINCEKSGDGLNFPALAHFLPMEGALTAVSEPTSPHPAIDQAQNEAHRLIAGEINKGIPADDDPLVIPTAYGYRHILYAGTIGAEKKDIPWLHELNTIPGLRATAGLGVQVIRDNQDKYVERAWQQLESLNFCAQTILRSEFSMEVSSKLLNKHILPLPTGSMLGVLRPILKKIKTTESEWMNLDSYLSNTQLSSSSRPPEGLRNRIVKRVELTKQAENEELGAFVEVPDYQIEVIVVDKETGAPINHAFIYYRKTPQDNFKRIGAIIVDELGTDVKKYKYIVSFGSGKIAASGVSWYVGAEGYCLEKFYFRPNTFKLKLDEADFNNTSPGLDSSTSKSTIYVSMVQFTAPQKYTIEGTVTDKFGRPLSGVTIKLYTIQLESILDTENEYEDKEYSLENFTTDFTGKFKVPFYSRYPGNKAKLVFHYYDHEVKEVVVSWGETNLKVIMMGFTNELEMIDQVRRVINPVKNHKTRLKNVFSNTSIKDWFDPAELHDEALPHPIAYPYFDDPMYEKVKELGTDYLVPNLNLMPNNCITLLKTNRKFIEAFFVGLNVEMGRELRWREFPTDERGSYFRQFWDVKGLLSNITSVEEAEQFKDILPVHTWKAGELGDHPSVNSGEPLVLAIRGGLIQAFPNAMIYAVKAVAVAANEREGIEVKWPQDAGNAIERRVKMGGTIATPIFSGKIEPDITLKGFPLDYQNACGDGTDDKLGYFFVIKEIAGELRFGLDMPDGTPGEGNINIDDLSWDEVKLRPSGSGFILLSDGLQGNVTLQYKNKNIDWRNLNSAAMANLLSQKPVIIAIHATEMLKGTKN